LLASNDLNKITLEGWPFDAMDGTSPGDTTRRVFLFCVGNGLRRSHADKRRCVENALKEFGGLSSRAIAGLCGVSNDFVSRNRLEQVSFNDTSPQVTGSDGKSYPATRN